jgi:hypothetical protein
MPRPTSRRKPARRPLALFALVLAVLAALPCAALAGEESCCGAAAKCGDATESPCVQLAATPCCEAGGAPLEGGVGAAKLDAPASCPLPRVDLRAELLPLAAYDPPARSTDVALRSVILRL